MTGKIFGGLAVLAIFLTLAAGCKRSTVDCRRVMCYEPVACCAGACTNAFDPDPPPPKSESECCSCRGSVFAYQCPSGSRCFREWQQYTLRR